MTTFLLSMLLLLTTVMAFVLGIAAGYWVICGILNLISPDRSARKPSQTPALASPASGD